MKKVLSIVAIAAGGLTLLGAVVPMIMRMILKLQMKAQMAGSAGIIGRDSFGACWNLGA